MTMGISNNYYPEKYHPDMDAKSHEQSYTGFVEFVIIGTFLAINWVLALAIGGVKQAWGFAVLAVILSILAATLSGFSRSLSWKPSAVAMVLLLLLFLIA
jgi:ABC-type branched-subunit amino acid transport system permease subunit